MKFILHIGMHKTGSSSIQDTFFRLRGGDITYLPHHNANHSGWFVQQFEDEDEVENYHGFRAEGLTRDVILERRRKAFADLEAFMAREKPKTLLISAEGMSIPHFGKGVLSLRHYIDRLGVDAEVVGYLRPPASFAQSIFQQSLQGASPAEFRFDNKMPNYRARFERFDELFGRDRVKLKKFDPALLYKRDVVHDFAHEIGMDLQDSDVVRSNESLSLEATALLYVQRRFGQNFVGGFAGAWVNNYNFITRLNKIGSQKLAFASSLLEPAIKSRRADIAWAEERIGQSLAEEKSAYERLMTSEEDLIQIAFDCRTVLHEATAGAFAFDRADSVESLASALDCMRAACVAAPAAKPAVAL